jgi:hypothetical protein
MRMAAYWLGFGRTYEQIMEWAAGSRHHYELGLMAQAIPEAGRAVYFAEQIRVNDPAVPFSRLWGWYTRGAWYAGYGRAPTAEERAWAYQRPAPDIGLALEVTGQIAATGVPKRYSITVNVPWTWSLGQVEQAVIDWFAGGGLPIGESVSYRLEPGTIGITLAGGALIARQSPTLTLG